ncbi:MAG: leucyl/phenylalanyl-tRNA--protein transferase [Bacteroidetes bacterium]|nr:MAG: leucyl/phenylalanyl-tRNA--protein transferase [Bacteroidota bacterium]PTM12080.1 MAG: leucyl/phenylalanyl-tRNA--protein transferase [Bacteroidota bacterium]
MPVFWLQEDEYIFPHPDQANPDGLLAVGGDLSPKRLLLAYSWGIFPWFSEEDPILWWHPDPRFVLFPPQLKVSKSMRPYFNQAKFRVTYDQAFAQVIAACSTLPRRGQRGTWITDDINSAYCELHKQGYAHSVEVWEGAELVGGLYGIALGKVFFGESMFARTANASKFGFITLVRELTEQGYELIDCQQKTAHLASLGASAISRADFLAILADNRARPVEPRSWGAGIH